MPKAVLVAGARTPIGRLNGALSSIPAVALGGAAIREAVERAGIDAGDIGAVVMGNVVQAGAGPNPARQAAVAGGIPMSVPATTINKLCLSGLAAIAQAAQLVELGRHDVVLAGGIESMSQAPHILQCARRGFRYGDANLTDSLDRDALVCAFDGIPMGAATERYQAGLSISREEQDEFAASSHAKATRAIEGQLFAEEVVPVTVTHCGGDVLVDQDEGVRPGTTSQDLARLRPAFRADGTITAGSASQLSDGACAVVVMSQQVARERGVDWLAELGEYGTVAGPDSSLLHQPAGAIRDALQRDGDLTLADLELIEINEAFAGVALASARDLGVPADRVNVNGGAIALGHPVGMSGARLALTLALELRRRGGGTGAAVLCGGGGQGDAMLVHVRRQA